MPQVKCEYCGSFIDETADKCPNCGAVNKNFKRIVSDTPKTIEELKAWYMARKLPPESITRFFIGKDIHEPKAFGIYKDGSEYVVYKNKADGSRAVRYQGTDEAYAVNEIYMKLKSEILNQKSRNLSRSSSRSSGNGSERSSVVMTATIAIAAIISAIVVLLPSWFSGMVGIILLFTVGPIILLAVLRHFFFKDKPVLFVFVCVALYVLLIGGFILGLRSGHRNDGYYFYNNNYYYCQGDDVYYYTDDDWYYYDSYDDFVEYCPDNTFVSNSYNGDEIYSDFKDSYYYEDWSSHSSSSSDWDDDDNDYDWDSGSDWDSGGSDWDSDW